MLTQDYTSFTKNFLGHFPCPVCGSSDNLSRWYVEELDDETYYCYTKGCPNRKSEADILKHKGLHTMTFTNQHPTKTVPLKTRGLTEETCKTYGVQVSTDSGELIFPYYKDGVLVAQKLRKRDVKEFRIEGSGKGLGFFGSNTIPVGRREALIITEGEIDALSCYQMTGLPTVSVPSGADSALRTVKENLKWLETFKKVYVCLDNDEAGNDAATEVMELLRIGVGYRVTLPVKDSNELLLTEGGTKIFKDCVAKAQRRTTNVLLTKEQKVDMFMEAYDSEGVSEGWSTGLKTLDNCTEYPFLLGKGEVTVLFASASAGKSSVARQVAANFISRKQHILYFALEETNSRYLQKIMGMVARVDLRYSDVPLKRQDLDKLASYASEYVEVANLNEYNWDEIEEAIEYAVRVNGVDLVIFDNITSYISTVNKSEHEAVSEAMTGFVRLGKKFHHHTIVVSHTRRDTALKEGEIPTMTHGYGGGGIERFADNVIGIGRVQGENELKGSILKHRDNGLVGSFTLTWNSKESAFTEVDINDSLRLSTGKVNPQPNTQGSTITPKSQSPSIPSNSGTKLQPRLPDSGETPNDLHRSQGEIGLRDATKVGTPPPTRTGITQAGRHKGFPTILQTRPTEYLGLGKQIGNRMCNT